VPGLRQERLEGRAGHLVFLGLRAHPGHVEFGLLPTIVDRRDYLGLGALQNHADDDTAAVAVFVIALVLEEEVLAR